MNAQIMPEQTDARLYLLLPPRFEPEDMALHLERVLGAVPVACVRLDLGPAPEEDWIRAVNHLIGPCHAADVAFVITDHYRLAEQLGMDGVHLVNARTPVREVRKALGQDRIVGAWAGASKHQGMVLAEAGADYVAFGPVGQTGALGDDTRAEDDLFAWWAEMIETPQVAEGGVSLADATRLAAHTDFVVPALDVWADPERTIPALNEYNTALA